jgi:molecular chaperone DnaJ
MKRSPRELSLQQCYEALGLEREADLEALKRAYRRRAFDLHPDLHPGNPHAGGEFQIVNEAYVILAQILQIKQKSSTTEEKTFGAAADTETQQEKQAQESSFGDQSAHPEPDDSAHGQQEATRPGESQEQRARRAAQAAYAKEEDVLRDLLNDPFARRVFEDIYAQVKDTQAPPSPPPPLQSHSNGKNTLSASTETEWGMEHGILDFSQGIGKAVKSWMRKQIDEEQTFHLPPSVLRPGARIRLQIRRGIGDELSTVEIKLPQDYVAGKPVRLKGMGKRIGRWQGDLYLTLVAKQLAQ